MPSASKLNIVVAVCNNMGIGIEGHLPWRLKHDMAFFKKITTTTDSTEKQNMVIMGKNTWFSIPPKFRPLPGRVNVVLSSQLSEVPEGVYLARDFDKVLTLAEQLSDKIESLFVIGGASVYKAAMESSYSCRIYLTRIEKDFKCDTFLPAIDSCKFKKLENTGDLNVPVETFEEDGIRYAFEVYEKNAN